MVDKIDSSKDIIGANFQNTFFRINSGYVWGKGQENSSYFNFRDEVVSVLSDLGFYADDKDSNSCFGVDRCFSAPTMHRNVDGSQEYREKIYCHPMNLSGIILKNSVDDISEALSKSEIFNLERVDLFEQYIDFSENELIASLNLIRDQFLSLMVFEASKTTRRDKFVGFPEEKVMETISPILGVMEKMIPVLLDYIDDVKKDLISMGFIISHKSPDPDGRYFYRSLNKIELKSLSKNLNKLAVEQDLISPSLPFTKLFLKSEYNTHEFKSDLHDSINYTLETRKSLNMTHYEGSHIDL